MESTLLATGEQTIEKLMARATEVEGIIQQFAAKSLTQVQAEFEAGLATSPGTVNEAVASLSNTTRDQAAQTIGDLKALDMWLSIKTPEVADGNNFGVDVQMYVAGELKKLRDELAGALAVVDTYHTSRAGSLDKIVHPTTVTKDKTTTEDKETGGKDGDRTTKKETTMEKATSKSEPHLPDHVKAVASLDAKQYTTCYMHLVDIRNAYVKANLMVSKNKKRLLDPRGDGEGTRSNAMSMF